MVLQNFSEVVKQLAFAACYYQVHYRIKVCIDKFTKACVINISLMRCHSISAIDHTSIDGAVAKLNQMNLKDEVFSYTDFICHTKKS